MSCLKFCKEIHDTNKYNFCSCFFDIDDVTVIVVSSEDEITFIDFEKSKILKKYAEIFKKEYEIKSLLYHNRRIYSIYNEYLFYIQIHEPLSFKIENKSFQEKLYSSEKSLVEIDGHSLIGCVTRGRKTLLFLRIREFEIEIVEKFQISFPASCISSSKDFIAIGGGDVFYAGCIKILKIETIESSNDLKIRNYYDFETTSVIGCCNIIKNSIVLGGDDEGKCEIFDLKKKKKKRIIACEGWVWSISKFREKYLFITSNEKNTITVENYNTRKQKKFVIENIGASIEFIRNGKFLVSINGGSMGSKIIVLKNLLFSSDDEKILHLENQIKKLRKKYGDLQNKFTENLETIEKKNFAIQQLKQDKVAVRTESETGETEDDEEELLKNQNINNITLNNNESLKDEIKKLKKQIRLLKLKESEEEESDFENQRDLKHYQIPDSELEILKAVGSGASGIVNLCRWKNTGSGVLVVTKEISFFSNTTESNLFEILENIKKEFLLMVRLKHPLVMDVYGFSFKRKKNKCIFKIIMEKMDMNVYAYVLKNKLSVYEKFILMKKMTQCINFLHGKKILHRDIKSFNFLISRDGKRLKITDFGMSKNSLSNSGILSGFNKGSVRWKSPETIPKFSEFKNILNRKETFEETRNKFFVRYTFAADIFSLGMTFYEILMERVPFFETSDDFAILLGLKQGERPNLFPDHLRISKKDEFPKELLFLLESMWDPDPDKRVRTKDLLIWFEDFEEIFRKKYSNFVLI